MGLVQESRPKAHPSLIAFNGTAIIDVLAQAGEECF